MLVVFRQLLQCSGVLVVGFFDSDDDVARFDHKVVTAYRWPVDIFSEHLAQAGFIEVQRLQRQCPKRQRQCPESPDRKYAAIAARAS